MQPHESQHTRLPCPSPTPGVYPNSCASSQWCHQPSHPLSSPYPPAPPPSQHQGLFNESTLHMSGQSIGVSASASVLPMALIKLVRVGHSPPPFWCLCERVSVSLFTLIKLCYTKVLKCSSLVPCSEAQSSFLVIMNPMSFTVNYQWLRWERICQQYRRCRFDPWIGTIPWGTEWQPTPVFLPREFNEQRQITVHDILVLVKLAVLAVLVEKAMAPHSSPLAWKIPWMEEPGRLQSIGSLRVWHDWATSLSLFTFMHWKRKWQPTPVFLPGDSQGRGSLVGYRLWGRTESDTTEAT